MKRKTNPDHKRKGFLYGVTAQCSCGWKGATWYGQGARRSANGEWHMHRDKHEKHPVDIPRTTGGTSS